MAIEGLGRLYDFSVGFSPVNTQTGANTGKRVSLRNASGVTIVLFKGAGTANDDPVLTLQQHTAASGGTTSNLAVIDHYYVKSAATLAGTETWTRVAQAASQTLSDPGGAGTSAESEQIVAVEVRAEQLADGYSYVSASVADTGSAGTQLGCILYVLHDLAVQRKASNLPAALA